MQADDSDSDLEYETPSRALGHCEYLCGFGLDGNIMTCPRCSSFVHRCCTHRDEICHGSRLVFTDGACLANGQASAISGIGVSLGKEPSQNWSIPVDDVLDPDGRRTSQRAELLAAIYGVDLLSSVRAEAEANPGDPCHRNEKRWHKRELRYYWIITTDSEYVVKGVTEWLPKWKENGWRTAKGRPVSNMDLFQKLDAAIINKSGGMPSPGLHSFMYHANSIPLLTAWPNALPRKRWIAEYNTISYRE